MLSLLGMALAVSMVAFVTLNLPGDVTTEKLDIRVMWSNATANDKMSVIDGILSAAEAMEQKVQAEGLQKLSGNGTVSTNATAATSEVVDMIVLAPVSAYTPAKLAASASAVNALVGTNLTASDVSVVAGAPANEVHLSLSMPSESSRAALGKVYANGTTTSLAGSSVLSVSDVAYGGTMNVVFVTAMPTASPTMPVGVPTMVPTLVPTTGVPTVTPSNHSAVPTFAPTTGVPSIAPTPNSPPTLIPTLLPTSHVPSIAPTTSGPTLAPSFPPTFNPTSSPTLTPTAFPSVVPSMTPTDIPSIGPNSTANSSANATTVAVVNTTTVAVTTVATATNTTNGSNSSANATTVANATNAASAASTRIGSTTVL